MISKLSDYVKLKIIRYSQLILEFNGSALTMETVFEKYYICPLQIFVRQI